VNLEEKVLSKNEEAAARNRKWLTERNIVTVNLISSPGTGKTLLLEKTLAVLRDRVECAVIAGDQRTDRDSARIRATGAKVIQIETGDACHLNAEQVGSAMQDVADDSTGILFIENVGNLVCPSAFDLGEDFKVGMVSVTEGEDKPVKYPSLFSRAPVSVVTKIDLLPHLDFDIGRCRSFLRQVHPGMFVFELSAKTGEGMESWIDYLLNLAQP
jgi:hydrogenase nickel incorporation protein HypB